MTRFAKLVVLGALVGAVSVIGCSDDSEEPGGDGGTGGGAGGTGGSSAMECGEGQSIDDSFTVASGEATCDGLGVIEVPVVVRLAARPMGTVTDGEETMFEVQAELELTEETVDTLGGLVSTADVGEASSDVDDGEGGTSVNVAGEVPCIVDFTEGGAVGIITPVVTQGWTADGEGVTLRTADITLDLLSPVPLTLSTKEPMPACEWVEMPMITFEVGSGGGGAGGDGGAGGAGEGGAGGDGGAGGA